VEALLELATRADDVAVVTHFVAINVAAGVALSDERTTIVHPANASVTSFATGGGRLHLV
jgi:broad specificity phosphatase PhoE